MLMSAVAFGQSQSIQGKIYDAKTKEGLPFANVVLLKDGIQKSGTTTDLDGNYSFTGFDPGTYEIMAIYVGYTDKKITGVQVSASQTVPLDIEMGEGITMAEVEVVGYRIPLIKQDETASGNTLGEEEIKKLPTRDVTSLIATTGGVSQDKEGEEVSFRGAREGDQIVYVDGVRVRGSSVPAQDIEQIQVITGGIPAAYGDVTGGVTNIITKGAASTYSGAVDVETSELLDGFGYNFVTGSVSGPILKKTTTTASGGEQEETILGFRLSGQFTTVEEPRPSYLGSFRASDDFVNTLLTDPGSGGSFSIYDISDANVVRQDVRPNARDTDYTINGKFDFQPVSGINLTFGGQYASSKAKQAYEFYRLLNYDRNPTYGETDWRAFARFRHKIGGSSLNLSDEEKEARTSALIQNINYSLQFDYTQNNDLLQDNEHKDNLFDYGYVGRLDKMLDLTSGNLFTQFGDGVYRLTNFNEPVTAFVPGNVNPALAAYYQYDNFGTVQDLNGGFSTTNYYPFQLFASAGFPFNEYFERQNNQIGVTASGGFDIVTPNSENQSKHSIQFGLYYEQRVDRGYDIGNGFSVGPYGLWFQANQLVNRGLAVNTMSDSSLVEIVLPDGTVVGDAVSYSEFTNVNSTFGQKLRDRLGLSHNEYVNLDALSPDQLSLDLFSADELINGTYGRIRMDYWGYNHIGDPVGTDVTFDDFFTARNADGELTREVAPLQPIYAAGYIQDKFSLKNEIYFNLGLRVDRYDANQKVLADPYSLYATSTVAETQGLNHPSSVGPNFVVYGDQLAGTIIGYRDGDQWYNADGNVLNNPTAEFGSNVIIPYFDDESNNEIKSENFDPTGAFIDYEPQITLMPRISFSFPLSEDAGFFAHYDILSRRPSNSQATALDYYYFTDRTNSGSVIDNPNLKPSKTIDYQVGFQQRLSQSSAVKISAYYREQRDEINTRQYIYAFPNNYTSYGNRDFGTVKGFTFQYDLRRTNNLLLKANYTLQFADGTGSNANSSRGSTTVGDVRIIYPYDFDQRHNLVLSADYRYGEGDKYNGPVWFGKDVLSNTGLNVLLSVGSGRPFTAKQEITAGATAGTDGNARGGRGALGGSFNGARLPWTSRVDVRLDKDIRIGSSDAKKPLYLNVYVRSQNVLNTKNVVQVFGYTQSATDDGWLASPDAEIDINSINPEAYTYLYRLRLEKSAHFGLPRRIRLGAVLTF